MSPSAPGKASFQPPAGMPDRHNAEPLTRSASVPSGNVPSMKRLDSSDPLHPFTAHVSTQQKGLFQSQVVANAGQIYTESGGHWYPLAKKHAQYQGKLVSGFRFTAEGFKNLAVKYDALPGAPDFIDELLRRDPASDHYRSLLRDSKHYPYFADCGFLVIPNSVYDPQKGYEQHPKRQKLDDAGLALCAWFIHPQLGVLDESSRRMLQSLSEGKPVDAAGAGAPQRPQAQPTIGQLRTQGEYLSSLLDLKPGHADLLRQLKANMMAHLKSTYGVNENDSVRLYFHFPYDKDTPTLHLHVRVNHGVHPLEKAKSFDIDELIEHLSKGRDITELILRRQAQAGQMYFNNIGADNRFFDGVEGLEVRRDLPNDLALDVPKKR